MPLSQNITLNISYPMNINHMTSYLTFISYLKIWLYIFHNMTKYVINIYFIIWLNISKYDLINLIMLLYISQWHMLKYNFKYLIFLWIYIMTSYLTFISCLKIWLCISQWLKYLKILLLSHNITIYLTTWLILLHWLYIERSTHVWIAH